MERDKIIKALGMHGYEDTYCDDCPYRDADECITSMNADAIALINALYEENKKLKVENEELCDTITIVEVESDMAVRNTVKKMFNMFEKRLDISVNGYSTDEAVSEVLTTLNNVAKEILGEL